MVIKKNAFIHRHYSISVQLKVCEHISIYELSRLLATTIIVKDLQCMAIFYYSIEDNNKCLLYGMVKIKAEQQQMLAQKIITV